MKKLLLATLLGLTMNALACSEDGTGGFFPENDWNIPENFQGGLSEEQFNKVIDHYVAIYAPKIEELGGKLNVSRGWKNGTVNASAQRLGKVYQVNMFGGLARHPEITEDGFALVLCHEIGHHIGGAPKVGGLRGMLMKWASNEGQSDYFASLKCLREGFKADDNQAIVSEMNIPALVKNSCESVYANADDSAMCQRIAMAGASVSNLFAAMRNDVPASFETPSKAVVKKTDHNHPHFQCRLDTYFQGALCDRPLDEALSQKDAVTGTCHQVNGDKIGTRPLCWYKP